ncbi:hypothetical protein GVX82_00005 [Patescibacteria group bacterium]|jgi:NAD(P)H-hydrate epimerase|nr:hypothetical protein [Patescibacteria group bacterium]
MFPALSKVALQDLYECMVHQYKVPLARTQERIGRTAVALLHDHAPADRRVLVLAGSGNNGGAGLVVARLLAEAGHDVRVVLTRPELFHKPVTKVKFEQLPDAVMVGLAEEADDAELRDLVRGSDHIIDALVGTGLVGSLSGEPARLAQLVGDGGKPTLSLDLPSGLDAEAGSVGPAVAATRTLTIAVPGRGLTQPAATSSVGELFAADVDVPDAWFAQAGVARPAYGARGYAHLSSLPGAESASGSVPLA